MAFDLQPENVRYSGSPYCGQVSNYEPLRFDKIVDAIRFRRKVEEDGNRGWVIYDAQTMTPILGKCTME